MTTARGSRFAASGLTVRLSTLAVVLVLQSWPVAAQTPSGALAGTVTDSLGGAVSGVRIDVASVDTGQTRTLTTGTEGQFIAPALRPGLYRVTATAIGFKRVERDAVVEAGLITTVDFLLDLGEINERVTVAATGPLLRHDQYEIGGVVRRDQIESLPLNGRNFLELARLEPGVITPGRLADDRVFVSSLGGGLQTIPRIGTTRVTVDGGNISTPGTVGVLLQVSQDVVQEFQMATVNFDHATSLTTNGAINIATRSGTNAFHGRVGYYYRDHRLSAYPGLRRDPNNPNPHFRRHQFGSTAGGPLRRDRVFFFAAVEGTDQAGVVSVQPAGEFARFGGIFRSPYDCILFNGRADARLGGDHNAFVRYTDDRNDTFANLGAVTLPSSWSSRVNDTKQAMIGITSLMSSRVVNDLRLSYFSSSTTVSSASEAACPNCFGLGAPRTTGSDVGIVFGGAGSPSAFSGYRYQVTDSVTWQLGTHSVRAGFDWEHAETTLINEAPGMGSITVFSPARVRQELPGLFLPSSFSTVEDFLQLPLRNFMITVGSGTVLWEGFRPERVTDLYRVHTSDTWRAHPRLTISYGVGWSFEPNGLTHDLDKPALLAPLLGQGGLRAPRPRTGNISPMAGLAWTATRDGRTVIRGGAGRYFDPANSTNLGNLTMERHYLSPLGTGSLTRSGVNILHNGRPLQFAVPTAFRAVDLLAILPGIRAELLQSLDPLNRDLAVRNLDRTKEGRSLYDPDYATPSSVQASIGVQREIARGLVVTADVVWKRFSHTFINGIDYNRWFSASGPVLRRCAPDEVEDVSAVCSNGPMFFDTTIGRARYLGLLARVDKRLSRGIQFQASYALGGFVGTNGTGEGTTENPGGRVFGFNNDDHFENYGPLPTDQRHIVNLSGFVELPWRLQLAANVAAFSAPPFAPYVSDMDFNGDGTVNDLLPGTTVNQFGRGLDAADLVRLVDVYNQRVAGTLTTGERVAPALRLPATYVFGDGFFATDLRVTWAFGWSTGRRAELFLELFNLFNTPNLVGFGSNLRDPATFGQPGSRFSQVFGSGGPRALQLGARVTF